MDIIFATLILSDEFMVRGILADKPGNIGVSFSGDIIVSSVSKFKFQIL